MITSPFVDCAVVLRVLSWDDAKAWSRDIPHTREMLVGMLRAAAAISNVEAKRLIKAVLAKEVDELYLERGVAYANMCHALQSIGAEVEAVPLREERR